LKRNCDLPNSTLLTGIYKSVKLGHLLSVCQNNETVVAIESQPILPPPEFKNDPYFHRFLFYGGDRFASLTNN
jgi:hypothetical protein